MFGYVRAAWRRFHRDQCGVVAVMMGLLMIPIMGMLALTLDVGYAYGQRRMAQNVADSGALAGAQVIAEQLTGIPHTDAQVLLAIRDTARNSSGSFYTSTDWFTAYYVRHTYDANGNGVPQDLSPLVQVGSLPSGSPIPAGATGVRVAPLRSNPTFFARALGTQQLYATATATALALDIVGFADWAPYAIWAGELAHRCFNTPNVPESGYQTQVNPNTGQTEYVYGCIPLYGGTEITAPGGPAGDLTTSWGTIPGGTGSNGLRPQCWTPPGQQPSGCNQTRVMYYSASYRNRNVKNGDQVDDLGVQRWNVTSADFKGFFHTNNSYIDIALSGNVTTGGGYTQGAGDLAKLAQCRLQDLPPNAPDTCLMVMPVVRYATDNTLTVAGFLPVELITDPYSSNDLDARITLAVMSPSRKLKTGPCPVNGVPCLKTTRLVR